MRQLASISLISILATAASGCWVGKTMCRGLGSAMPGQCKSDDADDTTSSTPSAVVGGTQTTGSDNPVAPTEEINEVVHGSGFALTRITPEQLSKNLIRTTNFGTEFQYADPNAGQTLDYLQMLFGVPLGGIDFVTAARRDPSTKAQTLLVSRVIAWQYANIAIWKEWNLAANARVVFTECNMGEDRPFQDDDADLPAHIQSDIKEGEERWSAQVDALFWRAYSRAPTAAEKAAVKTAFLDAYNSEGYPQAAWIVVLYAILSSQEFWHT
jgi:hypothetical protein